MAPLFALLFVASGLAPAWAQPARPGPPVALEALRLPGLGAPAQILVDTWGVPHLYARSLDDVYFVQGFNAARDRLFQIDLWRRRGLGQLAAVFGDNFVEQDRAARLFLYRGDMRREWLAYGPKAEGIATRFVAGINAFIDLAGSDPGRMPLEFKHFGYKPEKWRPDDLVRIRSHGLTRNLVSEVQRAWSACRGEPGADSWRVALSPPWETRLPEGLDPCIPPEVLRVFQLGTQGVLVSGNSGRSKRSARDGPLRLAMAAPQPALEGSNAWVVAPGRTATGRPILASDPHRLHSAPSLRYIVHLNAPGLNVIGAGEPALPGVSIGHNGSIAFGLTIFAIDQEDLFVYDTHPANPRQYRYQGGWEMMRVVNETIAVHGQRAQIAELMFTRHGPVLHADRVNHRAYALRSGWFEPGMAPYFGGINYMLAQNFAEFKREMANWGAPAENQVYADVAGNIGWVTGGLAPKRPNWDGLWPVPGDGRYEWAGFWAGDELPSAYNPAAGWFATANEQNLPAGYPYRERKLGFEWPARWRHQRIAEVLAATPRHSIEDSMRLQNDVVSLPARRLVAVLRGFKPGDARARSAAALLAGWDLQMTENSAAAALFQVWWSRHLGATFRDAVVPRAAAAWLRSIDEERMLVTLEAPDTQWSGDAVARRNDVLERSLAAAWDDTLRLAGNDPALWRWGQLHSNLFVHPLAAAAEPAMQPRLNVGPLAKQGGGDTVNLSTYDPRSFRQVAGASLRLVLDVGQWDNSRAINAPGQSGDPASPHYRDLAPLWQRGDYFPLLYSRDKIDAALTRRIDLLPGAGPLPKSARPGSAGK